MVACLVSVLLWNGSLQLTLYWMGLTYLWSKYTTNVFRISSEIIKKNLNFPYANMKWFILTMGKYKDRLFHNMKIRIKKWNMGSIISLESVQLGRNIHSFTYRKQRSWYHAQISAHKFKTINHKFQLIIVLVCT